MPSNSKPTPNEANPLHNYVEAALEELRSPAWIKSKPGGEEIICEFTPKSKFVISFNIVFPDGSNLKDVRYESLRLECYDYICVMGRAKSGGRARAPESTRSHIALAVQFLDHMLYKHWKKLTRYGFKSITSQDLIELIRLIASSNKVAEQLYDWKNRVTNYLRELASEISPQQLSDILEHSFFVAELPEDRELLELSSTDLIKARAALYLKKYYKDKRYGEIRFNTALLSKSLLSNTLASSAIPAKMNRISDLAVGTTECRREYPGVPTKIGYGDTRCSPELLSWYRQSIDAWQYLCPFNRGIPIESLEAAKIYDPQHSIPFKPAGHTSTLPVDTVIYALGRAVTFFYEHGEHILASLSNVLIAAHTKNLLVQKFCNSNDITGYLTAESVKLGIVKWSITDINEETSRLTRPDNIHEILRKSHLGLYEASKILNGAINTCFGIMSAPRNGELLDITESSLDVSQSWIELSSRKSGFGSIRRHHWRPIPLVSTHIFQELLKFRSKLRAAGIEVNRALLSTFSLWGGMGLTANSFYECTDMFCDYIEMPLDNKGRRYYIRQHQLRQFFIVAFFYASGINGIETLRWFVRHFNPEHLWAYLRQNISGASMMRHKSIALHALLKDNSEQVAGLMEFLNTRLGVKRFDVMEDEELVDYLTELQQAGTVEVEPVFFNDGNGTKWRLGVTVIGD